MKDDDKKPLIAGVERSLPFPFRRKRLDWSAELPETTIAIRLDRSRFSGEYTIQLGVHPKEFVNPYYAFKREDISTYGARLWGERLVPAGTDLRCFDVDVPMEAADREHGVAGVIALVVPSLLNWSTLEGLRALAADPKLAHHVHDSLTQWLGVPLRELPPGTRTLEREGPPATPLELPPHWTLVDGVIVRPYEPRE